MLKYESKVYSQNGEDGIIEHIFDKISTTNKIAVEFGVCAGGSGLENNTRNLSEKGWKLFWFDCLSLNNIPNNCHFRQILLTPDNIVETFFENNIPIEFDLLSIDVDGNDYHLREALSIFKPRVCIMEYNGSFDGETQYIMPRNDNYRWRNNDKTFGASLKSMTDQAERLGYDLVYCDQSGVNAFYIRKDVNLFEKKSSSEAYKPLWWAQ
jgi:hypothetical protein